MRLPFAVKRHKITKRLFSLRKTNPILNQIRHRFKKALYSIFVSCIKAHKRIPDMNRKGWLAIAKLKPLSQYNFLF